MTLHKMVNGVKVDLNEAEIAEFNARTKAHEAKMAERAKTEYLDKRKKEYPTEAEMIEALWEYVANEDVTKLDECKASKIAVDLRHPKPEAE